MLWFESGSAEKTCTVSLVAVQNGTVTVSQIGAVTAGQTVDLRAEAEAGWLFDHFTMNGKPIEGAFYTVAEDCAFGAVFKKVRTAALSFAQTDGFYLAVRRTGWKYDDMQKENTLTVGQWCGRWFMTTTSGTDIGI